MFRLTPNTTYHKGDSYTTVYSPSEITPPNDTKPPKISITYPINKTTIALDNLTLTFNLTLEGLHPIALESVTCKPSWQSDNITFSIDSSNLFVNKTLPFSTIMNNIPDGEQSITIYANTMCEFETGREMVAKPISGIIGVPPYGNYLYVYSNYYFDERSSSVVFTVDTSPAITPSPTSPLIADKLVFAPVFTAIALTLAVIVVVSVSLLLYRRHQKPNSLSPPDEEAKRRLRRDCLSEKPKYEAFIGKVGDKPVSYIIYFFTYSSFLALPTLFLEDIFVLKESRRQGIGQKMFDYLKETAKREGCGRIEFTVLNWNMSARGLYEKNGAKRLEWFLYRLVKEAF